MVTIVVCITLILSVPAEEDGMDMVNQIWDQYFDYSVDQSTRFEPGGWPVITNVAIIQKCTKASLMHTNN